jgi:hypothetical protein
MASQKFGKLKLKLKKLPKVGKQSLNGRIFAYWAVV